MAIYYPGLRGPEFKETRNFVVDRLLALRGALEAIPKKHLDHNLIVASWNLRDFGSTRLNPEPRLPECHYYIAEILDRFDVTAIQEVNDNMAEFGKLMRILGNHYDYIATDVTEGAAGNGERMVFVYDRRKVSFRNIAGEIVLPNGKEAVTQFARTPFVVSFQCGWLKFDLCTAHLYYGDEAGPGKKKRVEEIRKLGKFMMKRAKKSSTNTFILGDFNVVGPQDETWTALQESGFTMPDAIRDVRTNIDEEKYYDRIAFSSVREEVKFTETQSGGTFRFFDHVFRDGDADHYAGLRKNKADAFRKWSTWQMSDHLPLWVQIETDFADKYLNSLKF